MGDSLDRLGPYRLVRRLGVGGMAETFEAVRFTESGLEQHVCIKRVLPALADDPDFLALFRDEARLASELRHGNVVAVLGVGEADVPFLVLELVDGIDLRTLLATAPDRRLPPTTVGHLAVELAYALDYAHGGRGRDSGLVHRDLSPSNVLLARGGDVKLADFGLAKALHTHHVTQSGTARGKIPYMAPEQMRGEKLDGRADLFALGVVLYEALAGTRPFDGAHEVETMTRILAGRRRPLAPLCPDAPPALIDLIERLLAHAREDRPTSAEATLAALDALGPTRPARRLLASMIEARLGGPRTRAHLAGPTVSRRSRAPTEARTRPRPPPLPAPPRFVEPAADSTLGDAPVTLVLERPAPRPLRPSRRWVVGALAAGALAAVGARAAIDTTAPHAAPSGGPSTTAIHPRPTATEPEPTAPPVGDGGAAEAVVRPIDPATASATEASLRVVVHPWGRVWIDGQALGRAPRVLALPAGPHVVEGGADGRRVRRRVVLAPGEHRTVELDVASRGEAGR